MKTKYEIISHFLFPKFSQPKESRFVKLFSLNFKNNKYSISLEKIEKGEDKRTSVIIKNIPNKITKASIQEMLNGIGNINFIYLPFNKNTKKNFGFVIINVVNYKCIINLCKRIYEYNFNNFQIDKPIQVSYCKIQGKINLSKNISKNHKNNFLK